MNNVLLILPILIPLLTAIGGLLAWRKPVIQRRLGLIGAALHLTAGITLLSHVLRGGIIATQAGSWMAPYGITLVSDILSAVMVVLTGILGLATAVYSLATIDERREAFGYYPLLHFLLMGVSGSFLTGDLFNLYVWFEVMLMSSFVLLALGGERAQVEGALKYVILNLISSTFFLVGVGILYGATGTLNMADLAVLFRSGQAPALATPLAMFLLMAFGIKSAVFPLYFWLPASYHTPPIPISAIFAGLLTKVGVYALVRVFTLIFVQDSDFLLPIILVIAGFTMLSGVLGAASQNEIRRILSFHIISQIGYMVLGLGLFTRLALAGTVFYLIHHIIVKTNLFFIGGLIHHLQGTYQLKKLGGLYRRFPLIAVLFIIPAFSLAGIPPLSGFWAKLILIRAGLETEHYVVTVTALVVGLLTLYSMTKIWGEAFWKEPMAHVPEAATHGDHDADDAPRDSGVIPLRQAIPVWRTRFSLLAPIIALATLTMLIGFSGEWVMSVSSRAAEQLLDPTEYIRVVLGQTL